jgi:hypothetical protein
MHLEMEVLGYAVDTGLQMPALAIGKPESRTFCGHRGERYWPTYSRELNLCSIICLRSFRLYRVIAF